MTAGVERRKVTSQDRARAAARQLRSQDVRLRLTAGKVGTILTTKKNGRS